MKTLNTLKTSLTLVLLACATLIYAQPTNDIKVSMQGVLKNFDGTIVSDGNYSIELRLYDAQTGGTELWVEPQTVTTTGGVFNSYLGATATGLAGLQVLSWSVPYYVGMTIIGSIEMTPRIELTAMPYAIRATFANYANGVSLPGNVTIGSDSLSGDLKLGGGGTGNVVVTNGRIIAPNHRYDTVETAIGTWYNGKTIYRRVLIGDYPAGKSTSFYYTFFNSLIVDELVSLQGVADITTASGPARWILPYISPNNANTIWLEYSTWSGVESCFIRMVGSEIVYSHTIIIEYTKL
ncbi:MAG: hypothetical protein JKY53_00035 [Flavobacteriales bacterium]|nr:hypothetical protein [Flavobacteriales bacterium]